MPNPVVVVSDLSVERSGRLAVEQVSFELPSESETAVVGPNGAGKSTLVAALLGLLPRKQGTVQILGEKLSANGDLPGAIRSQIAYVPQSLALQGRFPLTVAEFVGFGFDPPGPRWPWHHYRKRKAAVERALDRTGCIDLRNRLLSELSGGQIKRVMLSFCVVRARQLLVLDEAQAGLDVPSNERFQQLLLELRRQEGWTVLHVSHDLDMVRRSSDLVLGLNRRLCCSGSPDHTLTPERLLDLYGPNMVPYRHQCHG
ncbi:ABC zinc transport system/ ATPase component [Synechococcus sp. BIOS-E4-1]|uniref:metal ABC transporter ATP-binding protein n=1 Tax=unclassified Synechococcus TaxID=2626047 RepID=UPI0007BBFE99|nr:MULTISPECIES: metal ABC transporter ATP-binding protein [unclassified Synechococcus]KZR85854.1 Zinc import ATP-binding protein ZnuC [Synechococcus sp. MIT S9504]KZR91918.1 Zinc import ATP-binding protein ZnuC [Synechococcus sp. MIT S9509]QNI53865.1 ABC zinc transport system/ ATPase component [Synechococcus sp. BIOS-E4-1]